jgi:hypothetical protein
MAGTAVLVADDFGIDWFDLASGGSPSQGGDFELTASLGQPTAGILQGGDFSIVEGFWSIATVVEGPIALAVHLDRGASELVLSWPIEGSAGLSLEETGALALTAANSTWNAVPVSPQASNGTNVVHLPLTAGGRFFRLHKP